MLRLIQSFLFTFFVLLVFNCNKPTGPIIDEDEPQIINYSNFQFTITDFTEVVFKNNDDLISDKKDVEKISVGYMLTDIDFGELTSVVPTYTQVDTGYRLDFELTINEEYYISAKDYSLRYYLVDDSFVQIDTTVNYFKYPYENTQQWWGFRDIGTINLYGYDNWLCTPQGTMDFELNNGIIYFNLDFCYTWGIAEYDIKSGVSKHTTESFTPIVPTLGKARSVLYALGTHFAVNDKYLICDYGHDYRGLYWYNLSTDSTEFGIKISFETSGIEVSNDTVYVLFNEFGTTDDVLNIYSISGELLNRKTLGKFGWWNNYIEKNDNILYIWVEQSILRLKIPDLTFLKPLIAPHPEIYGFDIHNDILYYWLEDYIYWLPLSDLRETE